MPLINTPKELLTEQIWKSGFRGIFVGGCIERKEGSSFRSKAHCHCYPGGNKYGQPKDKYFGYICFRSPKRLYKADGRPSRLIIHELAHMLVAYSNGHNKTFERARLKLQQQVENTLY